MLDALTKRGLKEHDSVFIRVCKCLLKGREDVDDFRSVAQFVNKYPHAIAPAELESVKREFLDFASDYSVGWDDDPISYERWLAILNLLARTSQ